MSLHVGAGAGSTCVMSGCSRSVELQFRVPRYRPNTSRIRAVLASAGSGVRGGSRGSAVSALGGLGARGGRPGCGSLTALTTVISYRLFLKTLSLNR